MATFTRRGAGPRKSVGGAGPQMTDEVPTVSHKLAELNLGTVEYTAVVRVWKLLDAFKTGKKGSALKLVEGGDSSGKGLLKEFHAPHKTLAGMKQNDIIVISGFEVQFYRDTLNLVPSVGCVVKKLSAKAALPEDMIPPPVSIALSSSTDLQDEIDVYHNFKATVKTVGAAVTNERTTVDLLVEVEADQTGTMRTLRVRCWDELSQKVVSLQIRAGTTVLVRDGKSASPVLVHLFPGTATIEISDDTSLVMGKGALPLEEAAVQSPTRTSGTLSGRLAEPGQSDKKKAIEEQVRVTRNQISMSTSPREISTQSGILASLLQVSGTWKGSAHSICECAHCWNVRCIYVCSIHTCIHTTSRGDKYVYMCMCIHTH